MARNRVPTIISQFNTYINNTADFLPLQFSAGPPVVFNWERLGLTAQNNMDWIAKRVLWRDTLYPKHSNPDTKTKTVNQQVKNFIKAFSDFARPLLTTMSASPNATEQDETIFNFKRERDEPSVPTTSIEEQCFASIKPLGGGMIKLSCRSQQDTRRASLPPGADSVQIEVKIGAPPPVGHKDGTEMLLLTKASGTHNLGADNAGKRGYAYFRWYNTKYPNLAGPFSELVSFVIA